MRIAIAAVMLSLLCLGVGYGIADWRARQPVIEMPAAEIRQADGSVVAPKAPDAKAKPKHQLPKGARLERTASVTVEPAAVAPAAGAPCPPVTVDLSLVREPDGQKRVVASSPDGRIASAIDIPVENVAPPPEPVKWAAGLSWNPARQTMGVWIERDLMRFRVGAEINQMRQQAFGVADTELRLRAGWTF